MDRRVADRENTPATMVVAVVNFSPVPPAMFRPSDMGSACTNVVGWLSGRLWEDRSRAAAWILEKRHDRFGVMWLWQSAWPGRSMVMTQEMMVYSIVGRNANDR